MQLFNANCTGPQIAQRLRDAGFEIQTSWVWLISQNFAAVVRGRVLLVSYTVLEQPDLAIAIALPNDLPKVFWNEIE